MSDETRRAEDWPEVQLVESPVWLGSADRLMVLRASEDVPAWAKRSERFVPESAPNVLSVEEARLLWAVAAEEINPGDEEYAAFEALWDRLETYRREMGSER